MTYVTTEWFAAASVDAIPDGEVLAVRVGGREVALYNLEGNFFATDAICTHQRVSLCDGFVENGQIECPLHQGRFDIRTGKALCAPVSVDLRVYSVRIDGQTIYIRIVN